ncbi:MAG TPA: globin [Phenylobacterium sp.]|nr:globin [Phenylobacterium sp.]
MNDEVDLIAWSLSEVAALHGDPTSAVYAKLFAQSPEMAELFVNDKTGAARGEMLSVVFETLLDFAGPASYGANMVRAEIVNHENLGVPPAVFATFFGTVMETIRELLGEAWTPQVQAAWDRMLANLNELIIREPAV